MDTKYTLQLDNEALRREIEEYKAELDRKLAVIGNLQQVIQTHECTIIKLKANLEYLGETFIDSLL